MTVSISNMAQVWMSNTNTYNGIAMSISTLGYGANVNSKLLSFKVDGNTVFSIDPLNFQTFAATSECAIIPPWVTRISVNLYDVTGTANMYIQIGQGSSFANTGYNTVGSFMSSSGYGGSVRRDEGVSVALGYFAQPSSGTLVFERYGNNVWVSSSSTSNHYYTSNSIAAGRIDLGSWSQTDNYKIRIVNASSGNYSVTWS